jgi:hypothetical protein
MKSQNSSTPFHNHLSFLETIYSYASGITEDGCSGLETGLEGVILGLAYGNRVTHLDSVGRKKPRFDSLILDKELQDAAVDLVYNQGFDAKNSSVDTADFISLLQSSLDNSKNNFFFNDKYTYLKNQIYDLVPKLHSLK